MSDMDIEYREFVRHAGKYLNGTEVVVQGRKGSWRVTPVLEYKHQEVKVLLKIPNQYGCTCVKIEGKTLCPKHGRY